MKGTLGMSVTLEDPLLVFTDIGGLITQVLGEIKVVEVKFSDTTGAE